MRERERYATRWKEAVPRSRGLRARARGFVRHATLSALGQLSRPRTRSFLRCLYAHYVFDDQKAAFERIIRMLKRHGTFIDTDACVDMIEGREPIDGPYFHLSFDDGFRNVCTNAVPILGELEVPSIVFAPTSFIGAEYEVVERYCMAGYSAVVEMASWDDLRAMVSGGHEVGSHTRTHARFSEMAAQGRLAYEIAGSKSDLERELEKECRYISWPFGTKSDADTVSLQATRDAGYRACFGAYRGPIVPGKTSLYSIPRHHFEPQWPLSHVRYFAAGNMEG